MSLRSSPGSQQGAGEGGGGGSGRGMRRIIVAKAGLGKKSGEKLRDAENQIRSGVSGKTEKAFDSL